MKGVNSEKIEKGCGDTQRAVTLDINLLKYHRLSFYVIFTLFVFL